MAINLNDGQFAVNNVVIFNGGKAGAVMDCDVKVVKKAAQDADNAPDYKIVITDGNGGEVNYAMYKNISEAQINFKGKELVHLANTFGYAVAAEADNYADLLDKNMLLLRENCADKKVNVAVNYGTQDYPKKYLQVANAFSIVTNDIPYINPKWLMERPVPTENPSYGGGDSAGTTTAASTDWGV